jgi:hypothetical protein
VTARKSDERGNTRQRVLGQGQGSAGGCDDVTPEYISHPININLPVYEFQQESHVCESP